MNYIKCCGFTDHKTIKTAIDGGTDAIGFITYDKSSRYVNHEQLKQLTEYIPGNIDKVAVMVNPTLEDVKNVITHTHVNCIQFHGSEPVSLLQETRILFPQIKQFKALPADETVTAQIKRYREAVDLFIIDTPSIHYGGTGQSFDWTMLREIKGINYLIAGGLTLEKIEQVKRLELNEYGYDLSSGLETDGKKDRTKIAELLSALKG